MPAPVGIAEHLIDGFAYGFVSALIFFPMVYGSFKAKYKFTVKESFIVTEYLTTVVLLAICNMVFHVQLASTIMNNVETLVLPIFFSYIVVRFFECNRARKTIIKTDTV